MSARQEDFVFAEHVLRRGFATEEQVQECLDLLERLRGEMSLEETLEGILLKRGYIAPAQAQVIRQAINPEAAGRSRNQIEGYRLLARLGSGAMGSVYKARHDKLDILVALKVLRVELAKSKTQVERLKREGQLAARLNHPNIVRSLDVGESNGFHYFAMEYVDGPTARNLIREGRMKEKDAIRIILAVARALEHAHANGIVHRDVKPANIMLTKQGQVKLGDFGLARGQGPSELTLEHAAIGTPQYLAPEQAASAANATPRSDLFSLGASLYHLVTGQPPFSGDNLAEIFGRVIRADFEPPESVVDDLSIDVVYIIHKLMRPNPKDRYANATELIADLEKYERGERVAPPDFKGDYQAFLDRRRGRRTVIAAVAVLVICTSVWFTWRTIAQSRAKAEFLQECRALNTRGEGELEALATVGELRAKHDALKAALAGGEGCDPEAVRELRGRVETLAGDLDRLERAEAIRAKANETDANFRDLARQLETIRPVLEGAAARRNVIRAEIVRLSGERARARYREVYVVPEQDSIDGKVRELRELAEELRTRFLDLEDYPAADVDGHAQALENLLLSRRKAQTDHVESFESALRNRDFDAARYQLDQIRQEWDRAFIRAQALLPEIFLNVSSEDGDRKTALASAELSAWTKATEAARTKEAEGRPDEALQLIRKFHSGADAYRKTAEEEIRRLEARTKELLDEQIREVAQLERNFRTALGARQYGAAVKMVRMKAPAFNWFGEGEQRFRTMEWRADAIERGLVEKFLPRLQAMKSVPVEGITRNPKRKTAPGSAFERAPGDNRDLYVLKLGDEKFEFGLDKLDYATLAAVFNVNDPRGEQRRAAGYFLIAEAYGSPEDPRRALTTLDAVSRLLAGTGDRWTDGVVEDRTRLQREVNAGEAEARKTYEYMEEAYNRNDHNNALVYCDQLLDRLGWTKYVQARKAALEERRAQLRGLASAQAGIAGSEIPPDRLGRLDDGLTEIRYTGAPYHPLATKVPPDEKDPEAWLRNREETLYKPLFERLYPKGSPEEFQAFFHRVIYQLLDWNDAADVVLPGGTGPVNPPGYVLQVRDPGLPDELWWQRKLNEEEKLVVTLRNHFRVDDEWSLEFTVDWVPSVWSEKRVVGGRVVAEEHRAQVPVYFAVACGSAQGGIGFFPKQNGGIAGTRIFFAESMSPEDAHEAIFDDFHWHMANDRGRKKIAQSDRAWLDNRTWRRDVPYRIRFARVGNELHLWMAPATAHQQMGGFVNKDRSADAWKKGKVENFPNAVHIWHKAAGRVIDGAGDFPKGAPRFRFFGRVRFTLRDVVVTGRLPQSDGQ